MADYCTLTELKRFINSNQPDDDVFLNTLITDSSREIDNYCGRHFYGEMTTHYFDAIKDVHGQTLYLDEDLTGVVSITNGDGAVFNTSDYVLEPRNVTPYYGVTLKISSAKIWTFVVNPENAIALNGTWGFVPGTTPPPVINLSCLRLARLHYLERSKALTTTDTPDIILKLLDPFKRHKAVGA